MLVKRIHIIQYGVYLVRWGGEDRQEPLGVLRALMANA